MPKRSTDLENPTAVVTGWRVTKGPTVKPAETWATGFVMPPVNQARHLVLDLSVLADALTARDLRALTDYASTLMPEVAASLGADRGTVHGVYRLTGIEEYGPHALCVGFSLPGDPRVP